MTISEQVWSALRRYGETAAADRADPGYVLQSTEARLVADLLALVQPPEAAPMPSVDPWDVIVRAFSLIESDKAGEASDLLEAAMDGKAVPSSSVTRESVLLDTIEAMTPEQRSAFTACAPQPFTEGATTTTVVRRGPSPATKDRSERRAAVTRQRDALLKALTAFVKATVNVKLPDTAFRARGAAILVLRGAAPFTSAAKEKP